MDEDAACNAVRRFLPSGDEPADLDSLYALLDQLGEAKNYSAVCRELIAIFEKYPEAELGSPGPIVHSLEASPIDEHVELLAASIRRKATIMTIWMAERCFRSDLSEINRCKLTEALSAAGKDANSPEVADAIAKAIGKYGT
jgi:hypothetical protein